jgi:UDP-glucose 4-epimerase
VASILITGFAGALAQDVAETLVARGDSVVGVDYRTVGALPKTLANVPVHRASYNKTAIEDVFRASNGAPRFDAVLHLGRVGNLREDLGKRFDLNVMGSQKLLDLCLRYQVRSLVVLSTFHIYGAHPQNHVPISEEDPLRAGTEFPQIADAIQLDSMASTWIWRHPEVRTVLLRPTNVVGPRVHNTMSKFLRLPIVPHIIGFNPMTQFVHERDLADAIVAALDGRDRGIFNIAGPGVLPWRTALEIVEAQTFPLPSAVAMGYMRFAGFPPYLANFYKYPCVITDEAFRKAFGWKSNVDLRTTLVSTVAEARARQRGGPLMSAS